MGFTNQYRTNMTNIFGMEGSFDRFRQKKEAAGTGSLLKLFGSRKLFILFIEMFRVFAHELINTSCGVNQFHLTGIEWMGAA